MHADFNNSREELKRKLDDLDDARVELMADIIDALDDDVDQTVNTNSQLVTEQFADVFAARLLIHHAITDSAMEKRRFEYSLHRTADDVGYHSELARSDTNPGKDIEINGEGFSLKTEGAKSISTDKIFISKLQEAKWMDSLDTKEGYAKGVDKNIGSHLDRYERILILRSFDNKDKSLFQRNGFRRYDLIEIPVDLLRRVTEVPADEYSDLTDKGTSHATVYSRDGRTLVELNLDGSDAKAQIRKLLVEACFNHARWIVPG